MAVKQVLTDAFTDTSIQKIPDDPMQKAGTLLLLDFGHSQGAFTGVPGNGAQIPNVAWRTANDLVAGAPGQAALAIPFKTTTAIGSASTPVKERTPKNGLNIIYSQANDIAAAENSFGMPVSVFNYIVANYGHSFFLSIWERPTRNGVPGAPTGARSFLGYNTAHYLWALKYGADIAAQTLPSAGANLLGQSFTPGVNTLAPTLIQHGFKNYTGSNAADITRALPYFWGTGSVFNGLHISHSGILYRFLLEDLTVSGRPYAEAAAQDLALWTAAFSPGGKFYGDTFTDVTGYP